jgi:hypothetical protein
VNYGTKSTRNSCASERLHVREWRILHKDNLRDLYSKGKGKGKAVPLHAMEALGGRGGIAPTHSRPRH